MKVISLTCPACGGQLKPGTKVCGFCGVAVEIVDERTARLVHEEAAEYCPICGSANRKVDTFRCTRCGRPDLCKKHAEREGVCSECVAAERAAEQARQEAAARAAQAASSKAPLWLGVGVVVLLGFAGMLWLDSHAKKEERKARRVAQERAAALERESAPRSSVRRDRSADPAPAPAEPALPSSSNLEQALRAAASRIARGDNWFTLTGTRHSGGPILSLLGAASGRGVVDALVEDLRRSGAVDRVDLAETADDGPRGYLFHLAISMPGWTSSTPKQTLTLPSLPRPPIPWPALLPEEQDKIWAETKERLVALIPPPVLITDHRREDDRLAAILTVPGNPKDAGLTLAAVHKALVNGGIKVVTFQPQAPVSETWLRVELEVRLEWRP